MCYFMFCFVVRFVCLFVSFLFNHSVSFAFSYNISIFIIPIGFSTIFTRNSETIIFDRGFIVLYASLMVFQT